MWLNLEWREKREITGILYFTPIAVHQFCSHIEHGQRGLDI